MAVGAILQATSFGVPQMIVGRIVWYVSEQPLLCIVGPAKFWLKR